MWRIVDTLLSFESFKNEKVGTKKMKPDCVRNRHADVNTDKLVM